MIGWFKSIFRMGKVSYFAYQDSTHIPWSRYICHRHVDIFQLSEAAHVTNIRFFVNGMWSSLPNQSSLSISSVLCGYQFTLYLSRTLYHSLWNSLSNSNIISNMFCVSILFITRWGLVPTDFSICFKRFIT